jgi:hypothetical protein
LILAAPLGHQVSQPDRESAHLGRVDNYQWPEVFCPVTEECKKSDSGYRRLRVWQNNVIKDPEITAPVYPGRILQIDWNGYEKLPRKIIEKPLKRNGTINPWYVSII